MELVVRNRVFLLADLLGWVLIPVGALALVTGGAIGPFAGHLVKFTAIAVCFKLAAMWWWGLYRRYWRYASIEELGLIALALVSASVLAILAYYALGHLILTDRGLLPPAVPVMDLFFTLAFVGGARFSVRLREHLRQKHHGRLGRTRVLIVGAGHAGTMIARELRANPQLDLEPVGFIDDDVAKHGNTIHGLPVLGGRERIGEIARDYAVTQVIIAMPTVPGSVIREIRDACARARLQTKTIPGVFEILAGRVTVNQIRDVRIDDLLRRQPVRTDQGAVEELVRGMRVLVTGAGGSIGSELCRQVARLGAAELVLVGHGENSIFDVHQELLLKSPRLDVTPVVADIRDVGRIRRVFDTYRPQAVFHAAAHKHVPLMELYPGEAVTNNCMGTANVLAAAEETGVERFVFISTDKAVNPASVMGATKLLAEMLVHEAAERTGKPYVSVRFGNVLASRGSVVPLFQKQIEAGGPLTVTHPDITRYFMTIPEAVQLVLQAATMGSGGETFVLDMGEPVRILQLAEELIHLSGLERGRDIEIQFTGLRPGEKLCEELFDPAERIDRTCHDKILVVQNGMRRPLPAARLRDLFEAAAQDDALRVRYLLGELVPEYAGTNARAENGSGVARGVAQPRRATPARQAPRRTIPTVFSLPGVSRRSPRFEDLTETTGVPLSEEGASMLYTRYRAGARLAAGKRVLELGCGAGQGLGLLGRHAAAVVGGDYSMPLLRSARGHYGSAVRLACLSADALPFRSASFDVVLFFEASYYVPDMDAAFRELARVVREGGTVLFVNANPERPDFIRSPHSVHYHSADEFRRALEALGFVVTVEGAFPLDPAREGRSRVVQAAFRMARRVLERLHLVPRTLRGRARLKRLVYGRLRVVPPELPEGWAREAPLVAVPSGPLRDWKVMYVTAIRSPQPS